LVRVTIRDVAKVLNLSVSTVSRALNDKEDVDERTRIRVKTMAREMGYTPNLMAKALKGKTLGLLGVVIDDNANPFYAEVVKGMEREAKRHGFHLLLVNTAADYSEQVFAIDFLQNKGVDGILVAPVKDTIPNEMDPIKVPFVIVGRHFENSTFTEVYNDEVLGGYLATKHLLDSGRRKIVTIQPEMDIFPTRGRTEGYRKALREFSNGLLDESLELKSSPEEAGLILKRYVDSEGKVDAVFAYNDMYALEAIASLKTSGFKVPEDVAVIGYDDIPYAVYVSPALTSVALDKDWLGRTAVELLIKMISGKVLKKKKYIQKPVLRVRDSG
jgi:LacI family transcriptional regulator